LKRQYKIHLNCFLAYGSLVLKYPLFIFAVLKSGLRAWCTGDKPLTLSPIPPCFPPCCLEVPLCAAGLLPPGGTKVAESWGLVQVTPGLFKLFSKFPTPLLPGSRAFWIMRGKIFKNKVISLEPRNNHLLQNNKERMENISKMFTLITYLNGTVIRVN
jgi:hypothetical protein